MKKLITFAFIVILILSCHSILSAQTNTDIFDRFPWLITDNIVDPNSCNSEAIDIYQQSIFSFLLVTDASGTSTLYNQDGQFYCQNAANYDCVTAYNFDAAIETWTCDDSCDDETGTIFFEVCNNGQLFFFVETDGGQVFDPYFDRIPSYIPVDGQRISFNFIDASFTTPCAIAEKAIDVTCVEILETPEIIADCQAHSGVITFDQCDDGSEFYFIRTEMDELLDAYLAPGLQFEFHDGQSVSFDYYDAAFNSPCSISDRAIVVTCIEEAIPSDPTVFADFPFLSDLVNTSDCSGLSIEVYNQGPFSFIFVRSGEDTGELYFQDGTFYCSSMIGYDCVALYNFDAPTRTWSCGDSGAASSETRSAQANNNPSFIPFPNPTNGRFTIDISSSNKNVQSLLVSDALGRIIIQRDIDSFTESIDMDISEYQKGIYYIVLQSGDERTLKKIVKQ